MKSFSENPIPLNDLLIFHQVARSLTSSFDLDAILRIILEHVERFIDAEMWTLLMLDPAANELYYAITGGQEPFVLPVEEFNGLRVKIGEGVAGWVAKHGETLIVPEAHSGMPADPRVQRASPAALPAIRSVIALPLRGRKGTHGVIQIFNPRMDSGPGGLTDYTIAFLHILADYAAIAIENAQDVARIQQLTITDDTTGLYNVRHFYAILDREIARYHSHGTPLSLAFLDLDRFKQINDQHGHLVGSELLARAGQRLRQLSRRKPDPPSAAPENSPNRSPDRSRDPSRDPSQADSEDLCFRYGGDEFILLFPATAKAEAIEVIAQIHRDFAETVYDLKDGLKLRINSSVGIATIPDDAITAHAVIGAADARMYTVKNTGRGRIGFA